MGSYFQGEGAHGARERPTTSSVLAYMKQSAFWLWMSKESLQTVEAEIESYEREVTSAFESPEDLYVKHRCVGMADATDLKLRLSRFLRFSSHIKSRTFSQVNEVNSCFSGSLTGMAERLPLLHKFLHNSRAKTVMRPAF
jgi:hypothetical protein